MKTLPNIAKSALKLKIAHEIDMLRGDGPMIMALQSQVPLNDKIEMLLDQYNDTVNVESARNGLYIVVGRGLFEAIKQYDERYNF